MAEHNSSRADRFHAEEKPPLPLDVPMDRYGVLRRNLTVIMVVVTVIPLALMAGINYLQYPRALANELLQPTRILTTKSRHTFERFLGERRSVVDLIASAYSFEQLADEKQLKRLFRAVKKEFRGFVDLGLIDSRGVQLSYVGPYELKGRQYRQQKWFQEVRLRGSSVSDVFLGYRKFPHIVLAVQHMQESGDWWVVRATIDTAIFDELIAAMGLDSESDAFLVNSKGILQTNSRLYGRVLTSCPICRFPASHETAMTERIDSRGRELLLAYSSFVNSDFTLVVVRPRAKVMRSWYTFRNELFYLFIGSVFVVVLAASKITGTLVQRIRESDEKRQRAFREIEHTHKLSSIGRLAAGVAHEINNPLAIIDQKTGLMKDLIKGGAEFPKSDKFLAQVDSVLRAVDRCRNVTHRLLGFARRMDIDSEVLDLNELVKEVLGFLEKEAEFRNIDIQPVFDEALPRIASDRAQLQQVFLNILTNALAAVDDDGRIQITTRQKDADSITVAVEDNGCGMSEATKARIFEPFFSTKKEYGTGLGLSITYGIVQKLGGSIDVESTLGEGTTFTVTLPMRSPLEQSD